MLNENYTGKDVVNELNIMQNVAASKSVQTNKRLSSLKNDGFHIGSIRESYRNNLGDKYLLCNGDYVHSWDGYEDLVISLQDCGGTWYKKVNNSIDGCSAYKQIVNDDMIFRILLMNDNNVLLRKYDNCKDYINEKYTEYNLTNILSLNSFSNIIVYQNKIYIIAFLTNSYKLIYASLNDLNNWNVLEDITTINAYTTMWRDSNRLVIVCNNTVDTESQYKITSIIYTSYDGITFKCVEILTHNTIQYKVVGDRYLPSVFILDNKLCIDYVLSRRNIVISLRCELVNLIDDTKWDRETQDSVMITAKSPMLYCDGHYWQSITKSSSSFALSEIYRDGVAVAQNGSVSAKVQYIQTTAPQYLVVRDNKVFVGMYMYDETEGVFKKMSNTTLRQYGFSDEGAKSYCLKGNDFYIDNTTIIPKANIVSALPSINQETYYTYIKAKE